MPRSIPAADELLDREFSRWERALARGKACYQQADAAAAKILSRLKPGRTRRLADGRIASVRDNFKNSNKAFRSCGVARFEPEIRSPQDGKAAR